MANTQIVDMLLESNDVKGLNTPQITWHSHTGRNP